MHHAARSNNGRTRIRTPSQQTEDPETSAAVIKGGEQQGIEVERLHQEPEKIGHNTIVTKDHSGLTGELERFRKEEKGTEGL